MMRDDAVAEHTVAIKDVLLRTAERRMMALGGFYADLQLSDEVQRDAVRDVQLARMWEQQQIRRAVRRAELHTERMAAVQQAEDPAAVSVATALNALARDLRSRALAVLQAEGNAAEAQSQQQLDAYLHIHNKDNKSRRKSSHSVNKREDVSMRSELPRVVLNINVGGGHVDRLVVRDGDDVEELAAAFVRRHGLPQSVIRTLVEEAQAALEEEEEKEEKWRKGE
ncbi:uncharacterized protein TM35_000302340 [Trypanosoma theileri]|uniref:Uncharacterized protein n=1 Tax=Trypanosoma theileri TaxID=67003 RepID=A0A1X0NNB1_9TRYP|nr:uncharacterized protein TM35_000302340 [Trypanosoma theileri]ORC86194.1 hypothetical protein TM35_000302340 [Trypanosoma theileri]